MIIDICLPTYNGERFIGDLIISLKMQTEKNWRVTIRDDGSIDNTKAIIKQFKEELPGRVKIIEDDLGNLGVCQNVNKILQTIYEYNDCSYIMLADQDDIWLEDKILKMKCLIDGEQQYVKRDLPLLYHTDLLVVDCKKNIVAKSFWKYQKIKKENSAKLNRELVQNSITGCSVIINKKLLEYALPIPSGVIMHDWWIGLVALATGKVKYDSHATVMYRQHDRNLIGANKPNIIYLLKYLFKGIRRIKKNIYSYKRQAKLLQARCLEFSEIQTPKVLNEFVKLDNCSAILKRWKLIQYKYFKNGFIQNLGLFLFI